MNHYALQMLSRIYLTLLLLFTISIEAQNQLKTYQPPSSGNITINPPVTPPMGSDNKPLNYTIGQNTDFSVRIKKADTNDWVDLFEYNTFVNSSIGDLSVSSPSSFVAFDFSGAVTIEITSNRHNNQNLNQRVQIRPLSRNVNPSIINNKITFTINNPGKFSIEIDGYRYHNLQIFANAMANYTLPATATVTYGPGVHLYNKSLNTVTNKKIKILEGAIVIVPYDVLPDYTTDNGKIVMNSGDEIYIEGGGTLKGGIIAEDVNNVKVYGHGIIDLTNYEKQYDTLLPNYAYIQGVTIRRCNNISIDGITIIDPQQLCVELTDSDQININNVKVISRAVWGDGFHMKGTSNVTINDCFNRTSDDSISIYASRHVSWEGNPPYQNKHALNITVTNTILYADKAHPITIGWHGNDSQVNGLDIYNLRFEDIDILEHDEYWVNPNNGSLHLDYIGAISINCADGNNCSNFLFKNIRVEDFSNGRLLTVHVEPGKYGAANTDGRKVEYIRFENLSYNGTGELPSSIKGLNCDRYVNGVHFENFTVNGNLITKLSDYNVNGTPMIDTNEFAYNITFQEANNYSTSLTDGYYRIRNIANSRYMQTDALQQQGYVTSSSTNSNANDQVWQIQLIPGTGHYRIKNIANNKFLENSFDARPSLLCQSRHLITAVQAVQTNQEWKIVPDSQGGYRINNAYTRSYLTDNNYPNDFVLANPKDPLNSNQRWSLIRIKNYIPITELKAIDPLTLKTDDEDVVIFPNPVTDFIQIQFGNRSVDAIAITDMTGRVIVQKQIRDNEQIDLSALQKGNYIVTITDTSGTTINKKIIKN